MVKLDLGPECLMRQQLDQIRNIVDAMINNKTNSRIARQRSKMDSKRSIRNPLERVAGQIDSSSLNKQVSPNKQISATTNKPKATFNKAIDSGFAVSLASIHLK